MSGVEAISGIIQITFTRYFLPGLVFYVSAICLPFLVGLGISESFKSAFFSGQSILVFSAFFGYLLDGIGAYSFHFHFREYEHEKIYLVHELSKISGACKHVEFLRGKHNDPDQFNAVLWLKSKEVYERIFVERAEWVAILEAAFSLLISACIFACILLFRISAGSLSLFGVFQFSLSIVLLLCFSHRLSAKGMQRMRAHNIKLIYAASDILD
jgi:hypothetical protein